MEYLGEFITVAVVHLLAVASPGPDFAMVLRQSLVAGRRAAIWTSIGIGLGILIHVAYTLLGLGLIISQSVQLFNLIKLVGAGYLLYIGWKSLSASPARVGAATDGRALKDSSITKALRIGFLTNALNPKATLFFLSLFSVIIKPDTPQNVQLVYGLYMSLATGVWFCGLSLVLTQARVQRGFSRFGHWAERVMGVVLIALGLRLALANRF
ncbi:MAG: LysE family transporter [Deltaproteobacteria bacterium]|nr:LysE family transporter [Deltaproteobacteria bacterium]